MTLRLAIIGAGAIGQTHIAAIAAFAGVRLAGMLADGLANLRLVEAIHRSAAQGISIDIDLAARSGSRPACPA